MRPFLLALAIAALPVAAEARSELSAELAAQGLKPVEARLAALPDPTDNDRFALAGVRFLAAVEEALQLRWQVGLLPNLSGMPFFSLPVPENPSPVPFQPPMIADLIRGIDVRMEGVRSPLAAISDTSAMLVEIDLADLWLDIDGSGTRSPGEDLMEVAGTALIGWQWAERDTATPAPVIRFDVADAAWLSAYSHLISGFSDTLLTYDPTTAIAEIGAARRAMDALRGPPRGDLMLSGNEEWIDIAAIVLRALNQPPDRARALAAHAHFLAMIADNRAFWSRAARETDNAGEWVPNDGQTSALGVALPEGTGALWLGVLSDAEALLNGTLLAPYLWLGDDAGLNIGRLFTDPRPIDIAGWVQGIDALPYLEKGTLVTPGNWRNFEALVSGNALLFAVLLN